MENLTTYLESSTIHGLAHIATGRKYVRLLWILVVIGGFTGAGVMIYKSFKSWDETPVKTTIETQPITEITFPKVTVCPPKNTYTDLNYDLMMTENMTLDNDTKNYAMEILYDHLYNEVMANMSKLEDQNRYVNWYFGYTKIRLPYYDMHTFSDHLNYCVDTTATTGTIATQFFGEKFDANMVERRLYYRVQVFTPLSAKNNPNVTLHFNIESVAMKYTNGEDSLKDKDTYFSSEMTQVGRLF